MISRPRARFKQFTVYWAGMSVDGVPLTAADNLSDFNSSVGFALYYGDCEARAPSTPPAARCP